jgi:hypothetical protein
LATDVQAAGDGGLAVPGGEPLRRLLAPQLQAVKIPSGPKRGGHGPNLYPTPAFVTVLCETQ